MTPQKRIRIQAVFILLIALLSVLFTLPKGPNWIRKEVKLHFGLDLAGGAHLVYQADVGQIPAGDRDSAVESTRDVIERRVNAFGIGEPVVQLNRGANSYRIIVELPGVTDIKDAIQRIGDTPVLKFKEQSSPTPLTDEEKKERERFNEAQKKKAKEVLNELKNATDKQFSEKASAVSEDTGTKNKGGDLDFVQKGQFVPEFDEQVFEKLKDNEISVEPVETVFGYHLIRRIESRCKNTKINKPVSCDELKKDGKDNPDVAFEVRARHILFTKQSLNGKPPGELWQNTKLSGEQLKRARVEFDRQTGSPIVALEFNGEGAKLFEDITGRNVNKQVAIFLDGQIISAPRVNQKITGGNAVITGSFTVAEAQDLAKRLNAGALPVPITLISQQQVGATLGQDSLQRSFLAGVLGMILVVLFMVLYYRLPGVVASIALLIYTGIIIAIFKLMPVVLTLSGIAGFIMSVGMAVDANVLIFERMKEELRSGKTLQAAIDEGFARAWLSIRDSNISTLLSAFILIWLGESLIKGFGITLAIGVLVSMFSAITITRVLLKLIARGKEHSRWI